MVVPTGDSKSLEIEAGSGIPRPGWSQKLNKQNKSITPSRRSLLVYLELLAFLFSHL